MTLKRTPPAGNVRRTRSHGRNQPGIVVTKSGLVAQYETQGEHALTLVLDRDPTVADYTSQPETMTYLDSGGRQREYTLDYRVRRADGRTELHIVRAAYLPARPVPADVRLREAAVRRVCQQRGWELVVHTEQTLPGPTSRANLRALYCYRARAWGDDAVEDAARSIIGGQNRVSLRSLASEIADKTGVPWPRVIAALSHMLWHGSLEADLDSSLLFADGLPSRSAAAWLPGPTCEVGKEAHDAKT